MYPCAKIYGYEWSHSIPIRIPDSGIVTGMNLPPDNLNSIADRLRWAMRTRRMTQEALAKAAGCTQATISRILSKEIRKPGNIMELCVALQISGVWLATGKGAPVPWGDVSALGRAVARRFQQLPAHAQEEVAGYIDYIEARLRDGRPSEDPLKSLLETLRD